jgi:fumarate hydratase subunit alpha
MARKIKVSNIAKKVKELCYEANVVIRPDVIKAIKKLYAKEKKGSASSRMLKVLIDNAGIAGKEKIPICQDTGLAAVFVEIGSGARVVGGSIEDAVNRGVEEAYSEYNFRKSVVLDPVTRKQEGTNTPAPLHIEMVEGDRVNITVMPKGFGSENKSRIAMLNPTLTEKDIVAFCVETVKIAGPDACPPYVLGVGIGGTMDFAALMSKKALLRPVGSRNPHKHMASLEKKIKEAANALGIGIMGLGGESTVMGVSIVSAPTHIAGCPVAVNVSCHALRSASGVV